MKAISIQPDLQPVKFVRNINEGKYKKHEE
jgi:hypothetical protein